MAWVPRGLTLCAPRRSSVLLASKLDAGITSEIWPRERSSVKTSKRISTTAPAYSFSSSLSHDNTLETNIHEPLSKLSTPISNVDIHPHNSSSVYRPYSSALPRHLIKDGEPRLKQDALDIYFAGLEAVEPNHAVETVLSRDGDVLKVGNVEYALSKNVYVAAFGKAVVGMVRALEDLIGDHIVDGVASVRYGIIDALKANGKTEHESG